MSRSRVLVVDDERHIVRLLQVNLERKGLQTQVALSGTEAIEFLLKEPFDRVILDYDMPSPNGYEVLEFIRRNEKLEEIWVGLMVSSKEVDFVMSLPCKAQWYSSKPFNPSELF